MNVKDQTKNQLYFDCRVVKTVVKGKNVGYGATCEMLVQVIYIGGYRSALEVQLRLFKLEFYKLADYKSVLSSNKIKKARYFECSTVSLMFGYW